DALAQATGERPLAIAGYSFGAWVAALVGGRDARVTALALIAPPLAMYDFGGVEGKRVPTLAVAGTADPYCPADDLQRFAARGAHTTGAEVEGVGREEDRHHVGLGVGRVEEELARHESERVLAGPRMLDEDDRSEGAPALRREGVDQHLDRRVETSVDRHPQEELVAPGEHATADDVARDRAHEEDDRHRRQEAEPRHGATEQLVVHRSEHVVDAAPEEPDEPGGEEDRDRE